MHDHVIEIVKFKLAAGVSPESFLASVSASNTFVKSCKGFISRRLSHNEDGSWLEHIEWETMGDAQAASEALMAEASCQPMMAAIDIQSVKMSHNQLKISVG